MALTQAAEQPARASDEDRRSRILAAAERAFVRQGFHAATMQDVAAEAGMSPGNLYRYFPSKDAIVAGLCGRDQGALAADFTALAASGNILMGAERMLRKQLVAEPRERCRMVVQIWAEATRDSAIAEMGRRLDTEIRRGLAAMVDAGKRRGAVAPDLDTAFAVRVILTIGTGLFKRRALEPDFDGEAEVALALSLIGALFAGAIRPDRATEGAIPWVV
jgi:AcrR family transcriptional regulator